MWAFSSFLIVHGMTFLALGRKSDHDLDMGTWIRAPLIIQTVRSGQGGADP